ncbi:MAG: DUF4350 domain-containing protein [Thiotrichaceae bacterium]
MRMDKWSHIKIGFLDGFFYVVFVCILGMLGYLAQKHQYQADWTFGNRNTLSQPTQQLLQAIDQPLSFVAYVPDDPAMHSEIKKRIAKYQKFKADISVEMVNPELDPKRAKQDGISYQGQVVVRLGKRVEVVESLAEQPLANVLQRLSRSADRMIIFLEGHEERQPFATESSGMSKLANVLKGRGFILQPHNLVRTQDLPENTQLLVIASPQKDLLTGEVAVIKKYIEQGGHLLWLHEPGSLHGLEPIEEALGLIIDEGTLVDANEQLRELLGIKHPAVIPVVDYNGAEISKDMQLQTLFPFATTIGRDQELESDWHYEDFLLSLPTSWLEVEELQGNVRFDSDSGDKPGPLPIGVSLTRTYKTDDLNSKQGQQRIVVVGDSDFMLNAFIGQVGNMDISLAIFNWLAHDDNLIAIKASGAPDTRLNLKPVLLYSLGLFFLIILPILLILVGVIIWYKRRKA